MDETVNKANAVYSISLLDVISPSGVALTDF